MSPPKGQSQLMMQVRRRRAVWWGGGGGGDLTVSTKGEVTTSDDFKLVPISNGLPVRCV